MSLPVQPQEEDEGIDMAKYRQEKQAASEADEYAGTIDMAEYTKSKEAEEATWWDAAKEAGLQSVAGLGQAFTYPLDILKMAMIGEGLTDIDELEDAFSKTGKPFDKNKYIQTVMQQGEFIPTQELLERIIDKYAGTNIAEPKTKTGKFFNKLFFLGGLTKGKGLTKAALKKGAKAGVLGASTTAGLRAAGVPEFVADLGGDVISGLATIEKVARTFTAEQQRIIDVAEKHGLPLMEFMMEDTAGSSAKISAKRKAAFEKELGMTTDEAIKKVVEGKIPISKLRGEGKDLEVLEDEAYEIATKLAKEHKTPIDTTEIIGDIDREIARIKSLAPSPSAAEEAAIRILEEEKGKLSAPAKKGKQILDAQGNPIETGTKGKTASAEQLIKQTKNYNSNVKGIYKKSEYSGVEDEVKNTYAFLNDRVRNTIEKQGGKDLVEAHKAGNAIFAQNVALARTEGLIAKAFPNGEFSAKKLNQVLNNKTSRAQLTKDIGEDGIKELRQIAEYGERAQKATTQFANSAKHKFNMKEWGPLAGFLLARIPKVGLAAAAAKPMWDYVRGWTLTRPVARKAYANIVKNAANGSFSNMAKDFAILENEVIKEYGSMDDFMKQGIRELQMYREGEEDED